MFGSTAETCHFSSAASSRIGLWYSARSCGVRIHGLPDAERPGIPYSASVVGLKGAKTDQSCPPWSENLFQSMRAEGEPEADEIHIDAVGECCFTADKIDFRLTADLRARDF